MQSRFQKQFNLALDAGRRRDYKTAVELLEALVVEGAETGEVPAEVFLYLGRAYHCLKLYAKAVRYCGLYLARRPESGDGWFFLARAFFAAGTYMRALQAVKKSLARNAQSADALGLYGAALLKLKRPAAARAAFEKALELAPADAALQQGYYNSLFVNAVKHMRAGDYDMARQMLTFLINNDVDGVPPRLYLGHALRAMGYLPEALTQYEAACDFAPDDGALPWYRVSLLFDLGKRGEALALARTLSAPFMPETGAGVPPELSEKFIDATIVQSHLLEGEYAKSVQAGRLFIRRHGADAVIHCLMGEALRGAGSYDSAINHFYRASELDGANPAARYGLLLAIMDKKDWSALDKELNRAQRAGCDPKIIKYYRCVCDAKLKKEPKAVLESAQEIIKAGGADPHIMLVLAEQYFRLGMPDLALNWYKKTLDIIPQSEEASLGYLASCEALGMDDELYGAYCDYLERWTDADAIRADFIDFLVKKSAWARAADEAELLQGAKRIPIKQIAYYRRRANQYRQAAVLYRMILQNKPDDRGALCNLAFCLDRMGSADKASRLMQTANRSLKPQLQTILIEGLLLVRERKLEQALDVFRKATDTFPQDWRPWHYVAKVYAKQGVNEMAAVYNQEAQKRKETGNAR